MKLIFSVFILGCSLHVQAQSLLLNEIDHSNWSSVAELIPNYKDKLHIKDEKGETALWKVLALKKYDLVQRLLDNGASLNEKNNDGWTLAHLCAFQKDLACLRFLKEKGFSNWNEVNKRGENSLFIALTQNSLELSKELYSYGSKLLPVSKNNFSLLHLAVKHKNDSMGVWLLSKGVLIEDSIGSSNVKFESLFKYNEMQASLAELNKRK